MHNFFSFPQIPKEELENLAAVILLELEGQERTGANIAAFDNKARRLSPPERDLGQRDEDAALREPGEEVGAAAKSVLEAIEELVKKKSHEWSAPAQREEREHVWEDMYLQNKDNLSALNGFGAGVIRDAGESAELRGESGGYRSVSGITEARAGTGDINEISELFRRDSRRYDKEFELL